MDADRTDMARGVPSAPRIILGLFMLVAGVLFILDHQGVLEFSHYARYWPVFIIALGLAKLMQPSGRVFGVLAVFFGTWALLDKLGVVVFDWDYVWPLFLVVLGGSMILRGARGGAVWRGPGGAGPGSPGGDPGSRLSAFALLGAATRKATSQEFRGGEATAVVGGCDLDLRGATLAKEGAVIDTFAMWGGIDIKVPEDWTVTLQGFPLLGGFADSRRNVQANPAKHLVVKGLAIMGGVEVKT
jgi:hypothetical protein